VGITSSWRRRRKLVEKGNKKNLTPDIHNALSGVTVVALRGSGNKGSGGCLGMENDPSTDDDEPDG